MAGWFSKAAAVLGRTAPPPPQPFHIACDCGEPFTGWRTESHQKLSCIHCDRTILVLPADVYPAVKRATASPSLPKSAPAVVADDDVSNAESPTAKRSAGKSSKKSRGKERETKPADAPLKKPEAAPAPVEDRIDLSPTLRQARSRRRTFRLVFALILALVGVTSWSLWQRTQREQARAALPNEMETGLAALRSGDFAVAARELTLAVQHLDLLRRTDAAAMTVRQAAREAVAADGLASSGLAELAMEILTGVGTAEERQRRFQTGNGTKWLIFDAGVVRRSAGDVLIHELDVPLAVEDKTLQVVCDFSSLRRRLADGDPQTPARVIFAAQVEEWLLPDTAARPIVARLRPSTAFLWTDYDSYVAAGHHPDTAEAEKETRTVLDEQRQVELTR